MSNSERKDAFITVNTGHLQTKSKSSGDKLEEELKRHVIGAIQAIVKWSKAIEKHIETQSEYEKQHPQDQAAVDKTAESSDLEKQ